MQLIKVKNEKRSLAPATAAAVGVAAAHNCATPLHSQPRQPYHYPYSVPFGLPALIRLLGLAFV